MISKTPHAFLAILTLLVMTVAVGAEYQPKFLRLVDAVRDRTAIPDLPAPLPAREVTAISLPDSCPMPPWPRQSLRNEETGTVTMSFTIAATGDVLNAAVTRSSGFPHLDTAALDGMRHCMFRPASRKGVAFESTVLMQYRWTLE